MFLIYFYISLPSPPLYEQTQPLSWVFKRMFIHLDYVRGFPGGAVVKNLPANAGDARVRSLDQEDPLEEEMAATPVFLPGKSHGQRNLLGYSPLGHRDMTEHTHTHTHTHKESIVAELKKIKEMSLYYAFVFPEKATVSLFGGSHSRDCHNSSWSSNFS